MIRLAFLTVVLTCLLTAPVSAWMAWEGKAWRDVDVRLILDYDKFFKHLWNSTDPDLPQSLRDQWRESGLAALDKKGQDDG